MRVLWVALVPDHLLIRVIWEAAAAAGTADVGGRLSCALGTPPTQTDAAPEPR